MIAIKRCAHPEPAWKKCGDPWYMPKFTHAGREFEPNVTRYAAVVLGKTITTATEADAVITDVLRPAIKAGTYVSAKDTVRLALTKPATTDGATIADVIAKVKTDVVHADHSRTAQTRTFETLILDRLAAFLPPGRRVAFGVLPIAEASDDDLVADLKAFKASRQPIAANTWAKYHTVIGQLFRFAVAKRYRATNPLATAADHDTKVLRRGKAASRRERIDEAGERRLLAAAATLPYGPWLVALITAAIETGMRFGELLALKWGDVDFAAGAIWVRAEEAGARKTGKGRPIPIFDDRLTAAFLALRTDEADPRFARTAYVLGDEAGGRVPRATAWRRWAGAVLLAHGHAVAWRPNGGLALASAAILRRVNWHFHDLRHEAGCRWLASKQFDLEDIRQLYGHASISQTAAYLHAEAGSAFRAVPDYKAYRLAKANADKAAAAAALKSGPRRGKFGANDNTAGRPGPSPRLIKGGKS